MKREPVESSALKSIGYNEDKQILEVELLETRKVYKYFEVPLDVYLDFLDAHSFGKYYSMNVRDKYDYKEVG